MKRRISEFFSSLKENVLLTASLKQFLALLLSITVFAVLTLVGVFNHRPQIAVPEAYSRLKAVSSVELEDKLRAKSPEVEELIFITGTRSVVAVTKGFENHRLVHQADLNEVRRLAQEGSYRMVEEEGAKLDSFSQVVSGWWWLGVIGLAIWLLVFLFKKSDGRHINRFQYAHSFLSYHLNQFIANRGWRRSRFHLVSWLMLVVLFVTAANLRLFNRDAIPSVPSDFGKAARAPAWTVERYLQNQPADFQRIVLIDGKNAAYVMIKTPANEKGERLVVERLIEFGESEAGKANLEKFADSVKGKNLPMRTVEPALDDTWANTFLPGGFAAFIIVLLVCIFWGIYILGKWQAWSQAEKAAGAPATTKPITADGTTGDTKAQEKPKTYNPYDDVYPTNELGSVVIAEEDKKTLKDVAGCDEAVEKFRLVARWIKDATVYKHFGAKLPKGVLLFGPPGTGKTLLARALAGEVNGNYFFASGSEFVNKYVGVGADNVRALFSKAKTAYQKTGRPSIVFIDEIDAVGKHRSEGGGSGGDSERDQTVNQLLTCIQGFDPNNGTLVIAATNRPDTLDTGLTRSGRFDYKVEIGRPDKKGRKAIFEVYLRNRELEPGITLDELTEELAKRAHDFVGADIELSVNEAAVRAAERHAPELAGLKPKELAKRPRIVTVTDLHAGIDQVKYGELIKSKVRSDRERRATAVHEVGHACIPTVMNGDPVSRITIVMTSKSLGLMESAPDEDRYGWTKPQFLIRIKTMLAGRIAEEQIAGEVSTGASNDFERASQLARTMVGSYGMSDLGIFSLPLNKAGFPACEIGPDLYREFNDAWRKIYTDCEKEAREAILANRERILAVAETLLEEETMTGDRFRELWNAPVKAVLPAIPAGTTLPVVPVEVAPPVVHIEPASTPTPVEPTPPSGSPLE